MSSSRQDNEGVGISQKKTVTILNGQTIPTVAPLYADLKRQHLAFEVMIEDCSNIPAGTKMTFNVRHASAGTVFALGNINGQGVCTTYDLPTTSKGFMFTVLAGAGVWEVQPELSQNATGSVSITIQGLDDAKIN